MDIRKKMKIKIFIAVLILIIVNSCASMQGTAEPEKEPSRFDRELLALDKEQEDTGIAAPEPEVPDFLPVKEEISPLKTRVISITAMQTPLKEVLHMISEVVNLNIVMEKGVDPELPISMTVKDIVVDEALDIIFDSADYFYLIKNNILIVKTMETEIFELGRPNIIQDYRINIGGDILSGASSGSGGEGQGAISGDVTLTAVSDNTSYRFWDSMEKSLTTLLSAGKGAGLSGSSFVLNRMAGTIMVTGTKKEMEKIRDYITNLKTVLNRQVMIEARIVEVQLSDSLKYGVDWTAVGEWLGAGPMSLSTNSFTNVITSGTPNFAMNIYDNDNLTVLLKALEAQGEVKTLSNPKVNIMNGQISMLSVGRNTTFISKVETTTTEGTPPVTSFTVETNSILSGLIFGLVPYINSDGEVTLTITPIITNLVTLDAETIGTGNNSVEIKLPTVDLREMSTTVKVMDGQMVIIGGIIDKKESLTVQKVPILGDIPLIGKLFQRVDKSYENTELIIMLIPRIIR